MINQTSVINILNWTIYKPNLLTSFIDVESLEAITIKCQRFTLTRIYVYIGILADLAIYTLLGWLDEGTNGIRGELFTFPSICRLFCICFFGIFDDFENVELNTRKSKKVNPKSVLPKFNQPKGR